MPLDPDDPDLQEVIAISNVELSRLESSVMRRLLEVYSRERDALLHRISSAVSQDTFGARHSQVIIRALEDATRRLQGDLAGVQQQGAKRALELGADQAAREVGQLEGKFGSRADAKAIASLTGVIPHRAVAAADKLPIMKAIYQLASSETRTLTVEMDETARAMVMRALVQGRSSRDVVPELAKAIGDGIDKKRWQLERTLRTGTAAAMNVGHNEGYIEASELLPDLKRQGHESLGLAAKSQGQRDNHPFSKYLHGQVADLKEKWRIRVPDTGRVPPGPKEKMPLPVMFWRQEGDGYAGMHYPAHLWDRGRQVPWREAWEKKGKTRARANETRGPAESRGPLEGWVAPEIVPDSKEQQAIWDKALAKSGLRDFVEEEGIQFRFADEIIEEIKDPATGGIVRLGNTAHYDPETRMVAVSIRRPRSPGEGLDWGEAAMVSEAAGSWPEAYEQTIVHELIHAKLGTLEGLEATEEGLKAYLSAKERRVAVSQRALDDLQEYLAESGVAYVYHREALEKFDSAGYNVVGDLFRG